MARTRYIKPDFFKDEDLCHLPLEARVWFQGLWCQADREGRLLYRPKRLKLEIFPYDDFDPRALTDLLADPKIPDRPNKRFIVIYSVEGEQYIQIINFSQHQNPHHTEKPSTIPALNGGLTVNTPLNNESAPMGNGEWVMGNGECNGPAPKSVKNPDTTDQDHTPPEHSPPEPRPMSPLSQHSFEQFKAAYPRDQDGKFLGEDEARIAWDRSPAHWNQIIQSAKNFSESDRGKRRFGVYKPLTFILTAWRDWLEPSEPTGENSENAEEQLLAALRDREVKSMPGDLPQAAQQLFFRQKIPWRPLQARVCSGQGLPAP